MKTLFLAFLLLASFAPAQEHPAVTAQPNTIYVGADGKFDANPDTAQIDFNVSAQEDNSRAAYDHASKSVEQIRQILRNNGIEPKTAQVGFFAIEPVYDYTKPKRKLIAYRVNTNVSLKLKDFAKVPPIVEQLADTDVTQNQTLNYTLEDMDSAKGK